MSVKLISLKEVLVLRHPMSMWVQWIHVLSTCIYTYTIHTSSRCKIEDFLRPIPSRHDPDTGTLSDLKLNLAKVSLYSMLNWKLHFQRNMENNLQLPPPPQKSMMPTLQISLLKSLRKMLAHAPNLEFFSV
jgi:hypothetical protein